MPPAAAEYNRLRKAVGWDEIPENYVSGGLEGSLLCICGIVDNQLVATARVVGDNHIYFYIQDMIVLPEFQGKSIGTQLMQAIVRWWEVTYHKKGILMLLSASGKEGFYEKLGFKSRPLDAPSMIYAPS